MYLPMPLHKQDVTQGQFFKWNFTDLDQSFLLKSTVCYLPIAGGRIVGYILFQRILGLHEMQTALTKI